jgi:cytochrome c-type biogenesis protein CcmH/NrfG
MNEMAVVAAIGVVAAVFILRPLMRGRGATARPVAPRRSVGVVQPATAVASEELAELELDRAMGRVSEEDFERWRGQIVVGVPLDEGQQPATEKSEPADAKARAEALVRRWSEAPRPSCPTCGLRPEPEARYCSNCGASLTA